MAAVYCEGHWKPGGGEVKGPPSGVLERTLLSETLKEGVAERPETVRRLRVLVKQDEETQGQNCS